MLCNVFTLRSQDEPDADSAETGDIALAGAEAAGWMLFGAAVSPLCELLPALALAAELDEVEAEAPAIDDDTSFFSSAASEPAR